MAAPVPLRCGGRPADLDGTLPGAFAPSAALHIADIAGRALHRPAQPDADRAARLPARDSHRAPGPAAGAAGPGHAACPAAPAGRTPGGQQLAGAARSGGALHAGAGCAGRRRCLRVQWLAAAARESDAAGLPRHPAGPPRSRCRTVAAGPAAHGPGPGLRKHGRGPAAGPGGARAGCSDRGAGGGGPGHARCAGGPRGALQAFFQQHQGL